MEILALIFSVVMTYQSVKSDTIEAYSVSVKPDNVQCSQQDFLNMLNYAEACKKSHSDCFDEAVIKFCGSKKDKSHKLNVGDIEA